MHGCDPNSLVAQNSSFKKVKLLGVQSALSKRLIQVFPSINIPVKLPSMSFEAKCTELWFPVPNSFSICNPASSNVISGIAMSCGTTSERSFLAPLGVSGASVHAVVITDIEFLKNIGVAVCRGLGVGV